MMGLDSLLQIGGKLIEIGPFIMSVGIIPWPVVFLTTDLQLVGIHC